MNSSDKKHHRKKRNSHRNKANKDTQKLDSLPVDACNNISDIEDHDGIVIIKPIRLDEIFEMEFKEIENVNMYDRKDEEKIFNFFIDHLHGFDRFYVDFREVLFGLLK